MSIPILDDAGNRTNSADYNAQNMTIYEATKGLNKFQRLLFLCALASFLATAMSVCKYYAGGSLDPNTWTGEQTVSVALGLMLVAAIVAGEVTAFSSGYKGKIVVAVSMLFIAFGVFTEVTQAMERENEGVQIRSQQAPTYKAAIESISAISSAASQPVSNPFAEQIAAQAQVVARCEAKLAKKLVSHCDGDNARLSALESQAAQAMAASTQSASNALIATLNTAKQWERDEDQHYGMIKLMQSWFGIEAISATFFFTLFIIIAFRVAFLWIGSEVATYKQVVNRLGGERPDTLNASKQNANQSKTPDAIDTLDAKKKSPEPVAEPEQKKRMEEVPLPEIIRLASLNILCSIADGDLKSFSVRAVCDSLKGHGYGKTNAEREQAIYPALLDHFEKEGYVTLNTEWIEPGDGQPNKNGTKQKWLIDLASCQKAAEFIPRG